MSDEMAPKFVGIMELTNVEISFIADLTVVENLVIFIFAEETVVERMDESETVVMTWKQGSCSSWIISISSRGKI